MPRSPDRVLVVSPHLDDAVLSCATLLASRPGGGVVTVFAGPAPKDHPLTEWDRRSGFESSAEAVAARREEDAQALALLDATPVWLEFRDAQYGPSPTVEEVADGLAAAPASHRHDVVLAPLGRFHSDHVLAHQAALALRGRAIAADLDAADRDERAPVRWIAHDDVPYRRVRARVQRRLCALLAAGIGATPHAVRPAREGAARKEASLACYRSQLRALGPGKRPGCSDAHRAESYWDLDPLEDVEP